MGLELGRNKVMMPIGTTGVAQRDLSHRLSPLITYKKGAFSMKNAVYSHPASAILRSPPKRDVTHIDIYLSKRKNNRAVEPRTCTSSPYNPRR